MVKGGKKFLIVSFLAILLTTLSFVVATNVGLTYDGNGNLITGDGKYREYNGFNQLVRVREGNSSNGTILEEYIYHPTEDRILVKRSNFGAGTNTFEDFVIYVNDNFVRHREDIQGNDRVTDTYYLKDNNGIAGEISFNTTQINNTFVFVKKLFYHNDHLGSTGVITNSSGAVVEETFYAPYGEILAGGNISRFDYEGREYSEITGDYDFRFRKYNAELGIFAQPDPTLNDLYDPKGLNRYLFEEGNPYRYIDEDGKSPGDPLGIETLKYRIKYDSSFVPDLSSQLGDVWDNEDGDLKIGAVKAVYYAVPFLSGVGTITNWLAAEQTHGLLKDDPRFEVYYESWGGYKELNEKRDDAFFASISLGLELTPAKYLPRSIQVLKTVSTPYSVITGGRDIVQDLAHGSNKAVTTSANAFSKSLSKDTSSSSNSVVQKSAKTTNSSVLSRLKGFFRRVFRK